MRNIFYIGLNDIQITLREKGIWINIVVLPVAFILLIGAVNSQTVNGGQSTLIIDVLNADESPLSVAFLDSFRDLNESLVLCPMDNDADDVCRLEDAAFSAEIAQSRLEDNIARAVIEIPAGFGAAVLDGQPVNVVYRSDVDPLQPDFLSQAAQTAIQRVAGASVAAQVGGLAFTTLGGDDADGFRADVYDRASATWADMTTPVMFHTADGVDAVDNIGFRLSVPGMGSMFVMFTVLFGSLTIIQERRQWTLQRMVTMPVTRAEILGGKMLGRFAMGMIQYSIAFGVGALMGINFFGQLFALLLVMIAFVACMAAIAFLLATFIETDMQASGVINFFVLVTAPLGGAWWPLEIVPPFMQTLAYFTPIGWAMEGFSTLLFYGGGLTDVLLPVAVLLGVAAVTFAIAITRFRYE